MKIKVCGMRNPQNIAQLEKLSVDYMGLIFYEQSPRYVDKLDLQTLNAATSNSMQRVGVFVDAEFDYIKKMVNKYNLHLVQLHGKESPAFCVRINEELEMPVIKAFNVSESSDLHQTDAYEWIWGYFLFDTKTPLKGGSGVKFDWSILDAYAGDIPFFLSGGISPESVEDVKKLAHPKLYGIDLNSKFETEPGIKDIKLLDRFIKEINV